MTTTLTQSFTKVVQPGVALGEGRLFVTIRWDGTRLSFTGVAGPMSNGDCRGSCGQVHRLLDDTLSCVDEWTPTTVRVLRGLWDRWHLNDMRAGCVHQRRKSAPEISAKCGVCGYKYGSAWLHEDVPVQVLRYLQSLPDSPDDHPWRDDA